MASLYHKGGVSESLGLWTVFSLYKQGNYHIYYYICTCRDDWPTTFWDPEI